ncbi:nudix hydrolase 8 isoform X2 [Teleopsis dalmanni]|nr:nudix hydrolase 8 isoform X2 [Teleopsis dalmanni]XP_037935543.1 nudix hydrolase 8 isoform X2 [Teleopsis dalmanni]
MDAPPGTFSGSSDRFNGITVESEAEYEADDTDFECKLKKSLIHWKDCKRRCIWFKVKTEHADWIPRLVKFGFDYHHAKPGYAMLCYWLPTEEEPNLPKYAHTMLGVGGVLINDKNEILVVRDRYAQIPNSWKLPGGFVEPKEKLVDATIREVLEETGIDSTFITVISFRHTHIGNFDCSDIYAVLALKPKNMDIHLEEREITKAQWMPIEEYLKHPKVHETNRNFLKIYLEYKKRNLTFVCENAVHQILNVDYELYYMKFHDKESNL